MQPDTLGANLARLMIFAVSDTVWNAAIAGGVTVILAYFQWRTKSAVDDSKAAAAERDKLAAEKVQEVKEAVHTTTKNTNEKLATAAEQVKEVKEDAKETAGATADKLDAMERLGKSTHQLVNSAMGEQLRLYASTARQLADILKTPDSIAAATKAEGNLADHIGKQKAADVSDVADRKSITIEIQGK